MGTGAAAGAVVWSQALHFQEGADRVHASAPMSRLPRELGAYLRRPVRRSLLAIACLSLGLLCAGAQETQGERAWVLRIDDAIGPAVADYLGRSLDDALGAGVSVVVLEMDTPGGLDASMREIVRKIISSPVPVVTYVSPSGARAASAGTYILYASHIAAMAPGTNLGAATPVSIGGLPQTPAPHKEPSKGEEKDNGDTGEASRGGEQGSTMNRKLVNDATAYLRSLAELRGRNAEWAERAVRESASLPAAEALRLEVVDLIAPSLPELLAAVDGKRVVVAGREVVLATDGILIERHEPDWRSRFLSVITNPNVAYILMLVGIYGLIFELSNPGVVLPGVAGTICLLLALYAFQILPVNYSGLALMLLGVAFMIAELFAPSFGALGVGGVIAFAVGSVILMETDAEGFAIAWPVIAAVTVTSAAFFLGILGMLVRVRQRPVVSGAEEMAGAGGRVLSAGAGTLRVQVHGEAWAARCEQTLAPGQTVRVVRMQGLTLVVEPETATRDEPSGG